MRDALAVFLTVAGGAVAGVAIASALPEPIAIAVGCLLLTAGYLAVLLLARPEGRSL